MIRYVYISIVFIVFGHQLMAQRTAYFEDPLLHYNRGLELYEKEQYNAARVQFEAYLTRGNSIEIKQNIAFLNAFCAMKLQNDLAEANLLVLLDEHPNHIYVNTAYFLLTSHYIKSNNYTAALKYGKLTNQNHLKETEKREHQFNMGYASFMRQDYSSAATYLAPLQDAKDKYYFPSNYYLGYMAMLDENWQKAENCFKNINESKIYGEKSAVYLAQIYYKQGYFEKVLQVTEPSNQGLKDQIRWEKGKAYYQLGDFTKGAGILKNEFKNRLEPSSSDRYITGMALYNDGDYDAAQKYLTGISSNKDPLKQSALVFAADCFLKTNRKSSARNAFYEASRLEIDSALQELALFHYAKLSYELNFQQEAVASFKRFMEGFPLSKYADEAKTTLSESFLTSKRYQDAIEVIESITQKTPAVKKIYQQICYFYANELLLDSKFDQAITYFSKAKQYPQDRQLDAQIDFWLGEMAFKNEQYQKAIKHWSDFYNNLSAPQTEVFHDALYNLGYAYFKLNDYGKAAAWFKLFTDKESYSGSRKDKYADGMTRLGDCYFIQRNYPSASNAYAYVSSKDASNSDYALFQQGMLYGLIGKPDQKILTLKRIPSRFPESVYVDDALYETALVYMQKEMFRDAIRSFSYLLDDYPSNVYSKLCYLNRALAYYNLNMKQEALDDYKTVVEKFSKNSQTDEAIKAITTIYTERGESDKLLEYLRTKANRTLTVSYEDSISYESAFNVWQGGNCAAIINAWNNYLKRFPKGYFVTESEFYRAECLYKTGKYPESLKDYLSVLESNRVEFMEQVHRQISALYLWQDAFENALPILKNLERIALKKENKLYAIVNQMYCNYELKNFIQAKENAEMVLANNQARKEDIAAANLITGNVLMMNNEWERSKTYFEKVYKDKENMNAKGAEALYNLAWIDFKLNNIKKAQDKVFELNNKLPNQLYWVAKGFILLGETYIALKDNFQARATFQSILDNYENKNDGILEEAKRLLDLVSIP